jgi:pyruvate/2-oxoglutarate dehydrogenase complex dihydrolipoamide acyltransferase (E2) component
MSSSAGIYPERRHTLYFLAHARAITPVFLDTEIDMRAVRAHREAARDDGRNYSIVSYVLHAVGRVLAEHPEANAAVSGRSRLRVRRYPGVEGKVTFDKRLNGRRIVLSAVIPGLESAPLEDIQGSLDRFRDGTPESLPEWARVQTLDRLPEAIGRTVYRLALGSLRRRPELMGTVAVTSLGHAPVDGFHSVGGTTITVGVGRIADRPVARAGEVVISPVMRLSLAFDHRVIDGAEAADVLAGIKSHLESFGKFQTSIIHNGSSRLGSGQPS